MILPLTFRDLGWIYNCCSINKDSKEIKSEMDDEDSVNFEAIDFDDEKLPVKA